MEKKIKFKNISKNKPIFPVKLKKDIDEEVCDCKPDDPSPCSEGSECILKYLRIECGKKCPAGNSCQNNKLRLKNYAKIELKKTGNRGLGVIASEHIRAGTLIIEYVGDLVNKAEMNRRLSEKKARKDKDYYFMCVDADLYIDAEPRGNMSRFINHSCDPNCDSFKIIVEGNSRIAIVSKVNIPKVS
jgi:histone-lysine N-methyltransferase NSD2